MTRSIYVAVLLLAASAGPSRGDEPAGGALDAATREALSTTIRTVLVEALPETIKGEDDWGDTKQSFSGLTWKLSGLKLDVDKRKREFKHGLWKKWEITPVDPAARLAFHIDDARSTGPTSFAYRITMSSPLLVHAQFERWRTGVKMLNAQLDADAVIAMTLDGEVQYRFETVDGKTFAVIAPMAKAVDLHLVELRWKKIGVFEGGAMREFAELFDDLLVKQVDRYEPKAVDKINAALAKRKDKLRFAVPAALDWSRWKSLADELAEVVR